MTKNFSPATVTALLPALFLLSGISGAGARAAGAVSGNDGDKKENGPAAVAPHNAPAVRVNDKTIGLRAVERRFATTLALVERRVRREGLSSAAREKAVCKAWRETLQAVVQDELLDQAATRKREEIIRSLVRRARGEFDDRRLREYFRREEEAALRRLKRQETLAAGGEKELQAALRRRGRTRSEWEEELRREMFRREVLARELGRIFVSPAAVREYYRAHPAVFSRPTTWRLRRIVVPKKNYRSADSARQAARFVHRKLEQGADFAAVARALGNDPPYDRNGGLLVSTGKTAAVAGDFPFEESVAEQLKDGCFSAPADRGDAYVVVLREGFSEGGKIPFAAARERAEALALLELVRRRKARFYQKLKSESFIKIIMRKPPEKYLRPKTNNRKKAAPATKGQ